MPILDNYLRACIRQETAELLPSEPSLGPNCKGAKNRHPVVNLLAACERRKYRSEALVDPPVAVEELLRGSKRGVVQLLGTLYEAESRAELAVKRIGVITHYFEPAAFRRTFRAKRADNDVAAVLDRARHSIDIGNTLLHRGEKMEDGAVVPNVICGGRELHFSNVGCDPVNAVGSFFQTFLGYVDCRLRYIKDGDVLIASCKEVIDESRFTTANINDGRRNSTSRPLD